MSKRIVCLVGFGGSGKTSAAAHLQEKYGFAVLTFSKVIREYAAANGLILEQRADYARAHAQILREQGPRYMTDAVFDLPGELFCADDLRSQLYSDVLRTAGATLLAFDCPLLIRFAHVHNHPDTAKYPRTLEAFIKNEQEDEAVTLGAGLDFDTAALMRQSDYHIDASKSLEDTFRQVDSVINVLLAQK